MRRIIGLLAAIAVTGCGRTDTRAGAKRVTIATSPGALGFEFSKDGRLALAKYIDGKAAIFVASADGSGPKRVSFGVWDSQPLWSPDGKWIALNRDNGNADVVIVPADSGAERIVAGTAADETPNGWLPDGSGLVFSRSTKAGVETWVYHLADGTSARMFDVDGNADSYPSPDGKWIGYTRTKGGQSTIWLWDREKHTHRQLTAEGFESLEYGCFSPDSRSILYVSRRSGTADLWRLDVATGERKQLTQDVGYDFSGRWSPDGTRIVFISTRGGQPDVWVLATGEGDVQRVTDDAVDKAAPVWTPDGRSIVTYVALGHSHLYSIPVAGGPAVPLTVGDWDVTADELSRDGTQVVYPGSKNGDLDIWTVPAGGGESHLVSGAPGNDNEPTWSPDGKRIAFTSARSGNRDIWTAPADSGAATQLTKWPTDESNARWSPDGKTIAFLSNREASGHDIWTIPETGGEPTRITRLGTVAVIRNLPTLRWSPDGRTIAFTAQTEKSAGPAVFVVEARGGEPRQIAPTPSNGPEWSSSGREIKINSCSDGYCRIQIRDPNGKLLRTLSALPNVYEFAMSWSHDDSKVLINLQDLLGDGGDRIELRPAGGGSTKRLEGPAGYNMFGLAGFTAGDKAAVAIGGPNGYALQRIAAPPQLKAP